MMAIACVTEAIRDPAGKVPYGLIPPAQINTIFQTAIEVPDMVGTSQVHEFLIDRVARRRAPLIMPWNFKEPRALRMEDEDWKPLRDRHTILIIATMRRGKPSIGCFNSYTKYDLEYCHKRDIIARLKHLDWYKLKDSTTQLFSPNGLFTSVPVANQTNRGGWQPCGYHTILNGWAIAMGLGRHINADVKLTPDDYEEIYKLVNLALGGRADFWLIYSFLLDIGFLYYLRDDFYRKIKYAEDPANEDEEIDEILDFFDTGGAKYFDRTVCMAGNSQEEVEKNKWNGETVLANIHEETKADEDEEDVLAATLAESQKSPTLPHIESSETSPPTTRSDYITVTETTASTLLEKLLKRLKDITKDCEPPGVEMLDRLLRKGAHLAWFVLQRLTKGTISRRDCARNKSFEQLAGDLLGKDNVHLAPALMQAIVDIVRELLGGDKPLS
jgi:hypothetical protein